MKGCILAFRILIKTKRLAFNPPLNDLERVNRLLTRVIKRKILQVKFSKLAKLASLKPPLL